MALIQLQCVYTILVYQVLYSVCIQPVHGQPREETCYSQGNVACKMWNYTNMDCSWRDLVCIPPLHHAASIISLDLSENKLNSIADGVFHRLGKLQHLDLSSNHISVLHDGAFIGLNELLTLDLSNNKLSFVSDKAFSTLNKLTFLDLAALLYVNALKPLSGSPFQDLTSLQTLNLSWQNVTSLSTSSLVGLEKLQILKMSFTDGSDTITGTPLAQLSSLRELYITRNNIYDCDNLGNLFIGLHNLQHLDISVGGSCSDIMFCSSFNASHKCSKVIPLTFLAFRQASLSTSLPAFEVLSNLTNLTLTVEDDIYPAMEALNSLDSPLQNLTLKLLISASQKVYLNSTTFASWGNWKASLQVFTLSAHIFSVEGAAFEWFIDLQVLNIGQLTYLTWSAFRGLRSLHELKLEDARTDIFSSGVLDIFSSYNSLTMLDLSFGKLSGNFSIFWHRLCNISSLQYIDLSQNEFEGDDKTLHWACSLPNLKTLNMGYQKDVKISPDICQVATQLESLDVSANSVDFYQTNCTCPHLVTLILTECNLLNPDAAEMHLPVLHELYLNLISSVDSGYEVFLNALKTPNLKYLYMSSNGIVEIEFLGKFFSNLTYLDLSDNYIRVMEKVSIWFGLEYLDLSYNRLTSISSLESLSNIRTLFLRGNFINTIPKAMLSQSNHPFMSTLDLRNIRFQCDCNVEPFRNWIITDNVVQLLQSHGHYQCFSPDSAKGFSITEIHLDCESHIGKYISISITCAIVLLLIIILTVHYWWHIKYRFFLLFNRRRNQQYFLVNDQERIDDDENGIPRYDAYVPYHEESADDWVHGELLPNIEQGEEPFRLFLRCRDMRIGRIKLVEISLHMQRSRKVLVILSPQFFEDNWCNKELELAHYRVLEENRNVMILIILEEIPDNRKTLLFRQLLCKVQCLKWPGDGYGQYLFWRRLREELKRPVPLDRRFAN
ncbi:toll-like receptor 2 type-2 [Amphiura filiformis]|uniref:toll-like receptor 2 type-2 n=1 Tax=Amphiura filiformis TaxID=82378 RepID=UPI003B228CFC